MNHRRRDVVDPRDEETFAPSTPAPIILSSVDYVSDYEPVNDELQAKVACSADLSVELSLFGWAEYDWDKETLRFDGYVGEDAAGEQRILIIGEREATLKFKNGGAPATIWSYFDDVTVEFDDGPSSAVGGVYLPNTPGEFGR